MGGVSLGWGVDGMSGMGKNQVAGTLRSQKAENFLFLEVGEDGVTGQSQGLGGAGPCKEGTDSHREITAAVHADNGNNQVE